MIELSVRLGDISVRVDRHEAHSGADTWHPLIKIFTRKSRTLGPIIQGRVSAQNVSAKDTCRLCEHAAWTSRSWTRRLFIPDTAANKGWTG